MKALLIGSGGREHVLAWGLARSPRLKKLFVAPGNAGTAQLAEDVPIGTEEIDRLLEFARREVIDLTIVGPEQPIALGISDRFAASGLKIAAPSQKAAFLEASKAEAKAFIQKYKIPTACFDVFDNYDDAHHFLDEVAWPVVIKADGLAAGKGVVIARTRNEAEETLRQFLIERRFGEASQRIVLEEHLVGREYSLFVASDGESRQYLGVAQDYKRLLDGDQGPNTGGMGAISPVPWLSDEMIQQTLRDVVEATFQGLAHEGIRYQGILYFGLIWTAAGPKLLEYNARFGDPETQVLVPRFDFDLLELFQRIAEGRLAGFKTPLKPPSAVCVVVASRGYPEHYEKGKRITGLETLRDRSDLLVFHAGTTTRDGEIITSGGRVLNIVGLGTSLAEARAKAYNVLQRIHFDGMIYRRDIGASY
jgi:phosphoribosylamine--glycine ligase